ncbi:MAG: DNA recombination protein RmuC [bacterium]
MTIYIVLSVIAILLIVVLLMLTVLIYRGKNKAPDQSISILQNQINEVTRTLDTRLSELHRTNQTQFGQSNQIVQNIANSSNKLITEVTEKITKLDETNKQIIGFSAQLQNLQDILKNPKQRGVLGEYYLETVLKNVLPPERFQMQYRFESGDIVDAVIFLDKQKILPIDSKFTLENYNKIIEEKNPNERERFEKLFAMDIKNRIDETAKYIRPKEGTMDFAFMFIPSEAIYYDLLVNKVGALKSSTRDLIEYAFQQKKVIIVSPTSFLAYLQTVLQGLRALKIEESAKEIQKAVLDLGRHMKAYEEYHQKLGNTLQSTVKHFNASNRELRKIDKDVYHVTDERLQIEPLNIDVLADEE